MRCLLVLPFVCLASLTAQDPPLPRPVRALVWEHQDQWTRSAQASERLRAAGAEVAELPLDRSPWLLDADLIVLGSFVSEHPGYAAYMKEYADDLYQFVDKGHLLVQLTQADQVEAVPPPGSAALPRSVGPPLLMKGVGCIGSCVVDRLHLELFTCPSGCGDRLPARCILARE